MNNLLLGVGFGLVTAAILALATVPLSLQMSVARIPNFAHGEILTAGAYAAYVANEHGANFWWSALAAAAAGGVVAFLMNALLLQPFARRKPKLLILFILTIAASLIIQNLILLFFGGNSLAYNLPQSAPHKIGPFLLTSLNLLTIGLAVVLMVAVHVLLKYTKFGKAQRAVSDNKDLARVTGINSEGVIRLTWLIDGVIAGFAGLPARHQLGDALPDARTGLPARDLRRGHPRRHRQALRGDGRSAGHRPGHGDQRALHPRLLQGSRGLRPADPHPARAAERHLRRAQSVRRGGSDSMSQYLIGLATTGVIFSIVALALNIRWGWAGEFDIALFAFVAIGAYVYSVITLPPSTCHRPAATSSGCARRS